MFNGCVARHTAIVLGKCTVQLGGPVGDWSSGSCYKKSHALGHIGCTYRMYTSLPNCKKIKYLVHLKLWLIFFSFTHCLQAGKKENVQRLFSSLCSFPEDQHLPFQNSRGLAFWCRFYSQVFTLFKLKLWKLKVFSGFLPTVVKTILRSCRFKKKKNQKRKNKKTQTNKNHFNRLKRNSIVIQKH